MTHTITKKRALLFFLLLVFFPLNEIACSKHPKTAVLTPGLKVPAHKEQLLSKIIAKHSERRKKFRDLKAIAEISIQTPQKKFRRKNVVILRNDPAIRFEVLSITGKPFIYFIANNRNTSIYYPDSNTLLKGVSSPESFSRIIGVRIELNSILNVLTGNFALPAPNQELELKESRDYYLLQFLTENNKKQTVFLDKTNYLPLKIDEYSEDGNILIEFRDYRDVEGYQLPFMVSIKQTEKKQAIRVKYKKVFLNRGVSDASFSFPVKSNMKILPLGKN